MQRVIDGMTAVPAYVRDGRHPYDRALTDLVGGLSTRSEPFRQRWATHNVRLHTSVTKLMHHPVVGDIEVTGGALAVIADEDLTIITNTAEPPAHQARHSASWPAGLQPPARAPPWHETPGTGNSWNSRCAVRQDQAKDVRAYAV